MPIRFLAVCFTALSLLISLAAHPSAPASLTAALLLPTASHNISDLSHEEPPLAPLDPIPEPADPLYARHAHLAFDFLFRLFVTTIGGASEYLGGNYHYPAS